MTKLSPESLSEFSINLLEQNDLQDLVCEFARQIDLLLGFDDAVIYLRQGESELQQVAAVGPKAQLDNTVANPICISVGDRIAGSVAASGIAELVNDTSVDSRYIQDEFEGKSELAVPIVFENKVIGVIDCESLQTYGFTQEDLGNLTMMANIASPRIASERVHASNLQSQSRQVEALSIFVGGIAHDFNNNLQAMMSSLSAAKATASADTNQFLNIAERACEKSRGLTMQLMAFAKGSATQMEVTDLEILVRETAQLALTTRNSTYEIHVDDELPAVTIDRSQIEQVVSNLLINADQAYGAGGKVVISLTHSSLPADSNLNAIRIQIQDYGVGIPDDQLSQIFNPHFTTKTNGNGLGLAISKFIVQRHNGEIQVASQVGKGTTFDVLLPANNIKSQAQRPAESGVEKLRILLVDDEESVQQGVAAYLNSLGYEPLVAGSAKDAICQFNEAMTNGPSISLVIIDLNLPDGDGASILTQLRKMDPHIPAIITSGMGNSPIFNAPNEYGFSGTLPKPFNLKMLQAELDRALSIGK